jgi:ferredoxin--NADP+ reductase
MTRVSARWIEGTVVAQRRWTERLFSLQVRADIRPFEAGQFTKLALGVAGEMVARPYSFVNPPREQPCEFYYVVVPEGPLTPRLARLEPNDVVFLAPNPSGFLVLSEVPDANTLWMLSTGTGIGPFLSILRTETPWSRYRHCVLVHAVRHPDELVYRDSLDAIAAQRGERFRTVRFVSRAVHPGALEGRVPAAIVDGRLERAAGLALAAASSQVMLCGNPDAVTDMTEVLKARGMKKHRRRDPGQITVENYW